MYIVPNNVLIQSHAGSGYLVGAVRDCLGYRTVESDTIEAEEDMKKKEAADMQKTTPKLIGFVVLMCVFFFFHVGVEVLPGTFLTTFAVKSELRTTKVEGTYVTAVFWASFAAFRFASIFLAIYLDPQKTMALAFALCLSSSVALAFLAQHSLLALQVRHVARVGSGSNKRK